MPSPVKPTWEALSVYSSRAHSPSALAPALTLPGSLNSALRLTSLVLSLYLFYFLNFHKYRWSPNTCQAVCVMLSLRHYTRIEGHKPDWLTSGCLNLEYSRLSKKGKQRGHGGGLATKLADFGPQVGKMWQQTPCFAPKMGEEISQSDLLDSLIVYVVLSLFGLEKIYLRFFIPFPQYYHLYLPHTSAEYRW